MAHHVLDKHCLFNPFSVSIAKVDCAVSEWRTKCLFNPFSVSIAKESQKLERQHARSICRAVFTGDLLCSRLGIPNFGGMDSESCLPACALSFNASRSRSVLHFGKNFEGAQI